MFGFFNSSEELNEMIKVLLVLLNGTKDVSTRDDERYLSNQKRLIQESESSIVNKLKSNKIDILQKPSKKIMALIVDNQ